MTSRCEAREWSEIQAKSAVTIVEQGRGSQKDQKIRKERGKTRSNPWLGSPF